MTNPSPTELETLRQLIATAARHAERASEKAGRNETAIRDLQQDVQLNRQLIQQNGTRIDRVEQRLDAMNNRLDSVQAGIERIEAIVMRLLPGSGND